MKYYNQTNETKSNWKINSFDKLFRKSIFFYWQLQGETPSISPYTIYDPWRGKLVNLKNLNSIDPKISNIKNFSSFYWIRDIRDHNKSFSRNLVRNTILDWFENNKKWDPIQWKPNLISQRISNLLFTFSWFGNSADDNFQKSFLSFIFPQFRCLSIDWKKMINDLDKLEALKGLIVTQAFINTSKTEIQSLFEIFLPILQGQLNTDGGHNTRQPENHLKFIKIAIECRVALSNANIENLKILDQIILKTISVCKIWLHGNGEFVHFNYAGKSNPDDIKQIMNWRTSKLKTPNYLPETGFAKFSSGRNSVILNTGLNFNDKFYQPSGALAFEFSIGKSKLIVNSGQCSENRKLKNLLMKTIAHSTLSIDGLNSSDFIKGRHSTISNVEIGPAEGGFLASCSHSGYEQTHGIIHTRKIFLANGGKDLRGSDKLEYTGAPGEIPSLGIIRFHLHPFVSARISNRQQVILKIRGQNSGWFFKSKNCKVLLDQSLYLNQGIQTPCQQIISEISLINIQSIGEITVNWTFKNLSLKENE